MVDTIGNSPTPTRSEGVPTIVRKGDTIRWPRWGEKRIAEAEARWRENDQREQRPSLARFLLGGGMASLPIVTPETLGSFQGRRHAETWQIPPDSLGRAARNGKPFTDSTAESIRLWIVRWIGPELAEQQGKLITADDVRSCIGFVLVQG